MDTNRCDTNACNANPCSTTPLSTVARLSDAELLARVAQLAAREREATVALVAHLAEFDARRLYLAEGYSSLFVYCTQVLHLAEHAAYGRIEAARAARRFPVLLELLAEGAVTLTTVGLLVPHLTPENHRELLAQARHRSKREVEELVARLRPRPPVPATVRRLPAMRFAAAGPAARPAGVVDAAASPPSADAPALSDAAGSPPAALPDAAADLPSARLAAPADAAASALSTGGPAPSEAPTGLQPAGPGPGATSGPGSPLVLAPPPLARPAVVAPLAPERYRVQFTASAETVAKLRLAQDLLRHQLPDGDVAAVIDRALTALVNELTRRKCAAAARPRRSRGAAPGSRHIPAEVRRAVWRRDGGRCAFVSATGRRCTERGFLEFHHVRPYAAGGTATADNIELRCRAHNGYEATRDFGVRGPSGVREPGGVYAIWARGAPPGADDRGTRSGPSSRTATGSLTAALPARHAATRSGPGGGPGRSGGPVLFSQCSPTARRSR